MKVIQINTVCGTGSTGKIATALYQIAEKNEHLPFIAYGRGSAPSDISGYKIGNFFDFSSHVLFNFFQGKSGFASKSVSRKFLNWLDTVQPDILHLHNIHGFYLHVGMLFDYIKQHNIPVVWTLHDCWSFTGQCAYFDYAKCEKWKNGCFCCPVYRTDYPYSLFKDNSTENYELKKAAFTGVENLIIITPSNWLAQMLNQSFLNEYPVTVIPNGIDLNIFKPIGLSKIPSLILGVASIWSHRKGLDFFLELADLLDESYKILLIGVSKKQQASIRKTCGNRITALTRTENQKELSKWYEQASVYVNPTLEDNFPTTNLEALACGTPVITFNTGGSPECISEKCGMVVEKGNIEKLKEAILSLEKNTEITSSACREQAMLYDMNVRFREYLKIYKNLL